MCIEISYTKALESLSNINSGNFVCINVYHTLQRKGGHVVKMQMFVLKMFFFHLYLSSNTHMIVIFQDKSWCLRVYLFL